MSPDSTAVDEIKNFIADFEERAAPREKAVAEAWWRLSSEGSEEAQSELVRAGVEYNRLFIDREEFERVADWHAGRGSLDEPLLARQLEVLYRMYAAGQGDQNTMQRVEELEAEANAVYGNHRGIVGGEEVGENEVRSILRVSGDEALRREAWEASKTAGEKVEGTVRELARLRNRLAREAGYENHYARSLNLQEIDPAELETIMSDLEASTYGPFRELRSEVDASLKRRFGVEEVMPWHLSDPCFPQTTPALAA